MKTISSFISIVLMIVISFFPEHKSFAGMHNECCCAVSAPRKKATGSVQEVSSQQQTRVKESAEKSETATYDIEKVFARSTSYSHDEDGGDSNTSDFGSVTSVPLVYQEGGQIGTAAVAGTFDIKFGDLIVTPDGRRFLAVDTGGDLKTKEASKQLADLRKKKHPEYRDSKFRDAEVIDFFMPNNKQVGGEWDTFIVIHCPVNFRKLKVSQRKKFLSIEKWHDALAQLAATKHQILLASN